MGDKSKIEWTDATWNPVGGCTRVSPGCEHCYAETRVAPRLHAQGHPVYKDAVRKHANGEWRFTGKMTAAPDDHPVPLRWRRPRRIFVCSTSDLFHEHRPIADIDRVFAVMALAQQHQFLVLTKRSKTMREYLAGWPMDGQPDRITEIACEIAHAMGRGWQGNCGVAARPLPNVWLGVSVEDQERADERIPDLLATPAAKRFISAEPLLGKIDVRRWINDWGCESCGYGGAQTADHCPECGWVGDVDDEFAQCPSCGNPLSDYYACPECKATNDDGFGVTISGKRRSVLDLIIAGGESGNGFRPTPAGAFESLRDQCAEADVAFFMKQMAGKRPIPPALQIRQWPTEAER